MLVNILLITFSLVIVYIDVKFNKIFNIVAYPLMVIGLLINCFIFGPLGIIYSLVGFIAGLLACCIPYKFKLSGLGEFKLLGLIGIFKGYNFIIIIGIMSYIIIFLLHLSNIFTLGTIKSIILNSKTYLNLILQYGISISTIIEDNIERSIVPYSAVIFISMMLGLIMEML